MKDKKVFFGGINVPFRNGINVPAALFYRLRNGINMPSLGKRGEYWPKTAANCLDVYTVKQIDADATMKEVNRKQMLLL